MKPSKVQDYIKYLLTNHPHCRDNDFVLTANYWAKELKDKGYKLHQALFIYAKGLLTPAESITRCRRKLQEMHPELRGKNYNARQDEQEVVKEDLRINFNG